MSYALVLWVLTDESSLVPIVAERQTYVSLPTTNREGAIDAGRW